MKSVTTVFAAAALFAATAANAVTYTSSPGAPDPGPAFGETLVVTFDAPNAPGYVWTAGTIATTPVSIAGAARPALGGSGFGYVSSAMANNFATLSTPDLKSISFYWGSIDTYNTLQVLGAGGAVVYTINGGMFPPATGNQGASATNRRVFITAGPNEVITGLTFRSTGVAFEFDNFAADAVPEPEQWALLIAGFGLVGAAARRQRRNSGAVA